MHSDSSEASTLPPDSTAQTSPSAGGAHAALHQRRHRHRARALDHELRALEQQHHRLGDLVVGDRHDLVHVALDQRQREVARALDRDAVADRVRRARADRPVGRERVDVGGAGLGLDADDARARQPLGHRQPDPARQAAAAERHDHQLRVGRLARDLEPDRALPGHDLGLVEGVHRGQALLLRRAARPRRARRRSCRRAGAPRRRTGAPPRPSPAAPPPASRAPRARRRRAPRRPRPGRGCRRWPPPPRRAAPRSGRRPIMLVAPRALNDPVSWRFSALSTHARAHAARQLAGRTASACRAPFRRSGARRPRRPRGSRLHVRLPCSHYPHMPNGEETARLLAAHGGVRRPRAARAAGDRPGRRAAPLGPRRGHLPRGRHRRHLLPAALRRGGAHARAPGRPHGRARRAARRRAVRRAGDVPRRDALGHGRGDRADAAPWRCWPATCSA